MNLALVLAGVELATKLADALGPAAAELLRQKDLGPDQEKELKEALAEWQSRSAGALKQAYEDLG